MDLLSHHSSIFCARPFIAAAETVAVVQFYLPSVLCAQRFTAAALVVAVVLFQFQSVARAFSLSIGTVIVIAALSHCPSGLISYLFYATALKDGFVLIYRLSGHFVWPLFCRCYDKCFFKYCSSIYLERFPITCLYLAFL